MGVSGYDGVYRDAGEGTLQRIHSHPCERLFTHEPLVEWSKPTPREAVLNKVHHIMSTVKGKLKGADNAYNCK